ncbi:putative metal-nicotianamine transporter YSL7 [Cinnamomum micranthum f. kanehirae]|uniref:Putative metal-nicotianamine transporter YSL7 n=1 Tax=Cinnamomum micranthum f. kanehirae TaxID=337451 RepID=A0A3S3MF32_9MAGN|nr:putative metal-nicotianamine transporter YSL7 [Cinnamomum micranthum f. kanehirae]
MQTCIVAASGVALSGTIQTNTNAFRREMKDDEHCSSMEMMEVDHEIERIENESRKHSIMTVESVFEGDEVPSSWRDSPTMRGLFASLILGTLFTFIVLNFNQRTGYVHSLNVGAGLLGFFFTKTWMKVSTKLGFKQLRGIFASVILETLFTFIVMNFDLTAGYVRSH